MEKITQEKYQVPSAKYQVRTWAFIAVCSVILIVLWLPGLKYPIVSDTSAYALLGKSLWEQGRYALLGEPYARFLPLHAFLSYPLTSLLGLHAGMKTATLLAGCGVLTFAFLLFRRSSSSLVAVITTIAILLHPAFILMTQLGSADLPFTALFLLSIYAFVRAERERRWYIISGLAAGAMCLTRYNGLPVLFLLFFWGLVVRRDWRHQWFWIGMILGGSLVDLWFLRNFLLFGDLFHTEYAAELATTSSGYLRQFLSNVAYYVNPIHNILPFFLPFSLYGLWRYGRSHLILVLAMLAVWLLASIWWVQAMRFAFPGYVLLLGFAAAGIADLANRVKWKTFFWTLCIGGFLAVHLPAICLYTYGECNALIDRTIGVLPKNLGLTPEGFYAWHQAREYLSAHAESGALVVDDGFLNAIVWREGVFRKDIQVLEKTENRCPSYRIVQSHNVDPLEEVLFTTEEAPMTSVTKVRCPG